MRPDWILSPLAQYGMAAAGLIAGLFLFFALKVELSALKRSGETARDELTGPRGEGYRRMLELSPAGRGGTPMRWVRSARSSWA